MSDTYVYSTDVDEMADYPLWLQAAAADPAIPITVEDLRQAIGVDGVTSGVYDGSHLIVGARGAGPNFSADIGHGKAVVNCTTIDDGGKYLLRTTGTVNLPLPNPPVSGTRLHRIVAQVLDNQIDSIGLYGWRFRCLEDTGTGTPPTPPNAVSLSIAQARAGASGYLATDFTDDRSPTSHQVGCGLSRSSSQGLTANIRQHINWTAEDDDTFNLVNLSADDATVNLRHPGIYDFSFQAYWPAATSNTQTIEIGLCSDTSLTNVIASVKGFGEAHGGQLNCTWVGEYLPANTPIQAYAYTVISGQSVSNLKLRIRRSEYRA